MLWLPLKYVQSKEHKNPLLRSRLLLGDCALWPSPVCGGTVSPFPHGIVMVSALYWARGEQLTSFLWNCFSIPITLRLVVRPATFGVPLSFFFLGSVVISASLPGACGARCLVLARVDVTVLPLGLCSLHLFLYLCLKLTKKAEQITDNWQE